MMVAAFDPVVPGSSISHYESVAFPNQLMEPAINPDLTSSLTPPEDLTLPLMTDSGWFSDQDGVPDGADSCIGSDLAPTVVIEKCDSRAVNEVLSDGCSVSDRIQECDETTTSPLRYLACVGRRTLAFRKAGVITAREQAGILFCAIKSIVH